MLSAERIALLKHGAPPRNALEAALRNAWGGGAGYEKTVGPAPIISISDAKPKPAKSLIVGMEPIQDLHGYDSPWPAGGSTNLWDGKFVDSRFTEVDFAAESVYVGNAAMSITVGTAYIASINGTVEGIRYRWLDSNKSAISTLTNANYTDPAPEGAAYLQWRTRVYAQENGKYQIQTGTSVSAWVPYSNLCPITGRTGVTAYRTGKNLLDPAERQNIGTSNIHFYFTAGLLLKAGQAYTFSVSTPAAQLTFLAMDGTTLAIVYSTTKKTYTPSEDVLVKFDAYFSGQYPAPSGGLSEVNCQLEIGSTASAYEPYTGTSYPVSWQTEAGTVYGGTVDVVSGVLTVDRVIDTITKDSAWYGFYTGTGNSSAVVQLSNYLNIKYVNGASSFNGAISSTGREAQNYWTGGRQNEIPNEGDMCFAYSQTGQLRFHRSDVANITDLASFKANFPDTAICYYLATPQTYQLTPQQIQLLKGSNTLWSDGDSLTLTYLGTTPANLLGGMLGGGLGGAQEPTEETSEEPTEGENE